MIPSPVNRYMPTKRKTSLQCSASPQTCQAAKARATNGISVTRPVMIRSRVSLATGWMSEGRGPALLSMRGRLYARAPEARHETGGREYARRMPFASTAPLRREIEARIPERPFAVEFWDGTRLPPTADGGPDLLRALAAGRRPRAAGAGPARPRPRLRQRRDRGRRHGRGDRAARQLEAAGARRRRQGAACCSARCAPPGLTLPPAPARRRAAAERPPPLARSATRARSATTTTSPTSSSRSSSTTR